MAVPAAQPGCGRGSGRCYGRRPKSTTRGPGQAKSEDRTLPRPARPAIAAHERVEIRGRDAVRTVRAVDRRGVAVTASRPGVDARPLTPRRNTPRERRTPTPVIIWRRCSAVGAAPTA